MSLHLLKIIKKARLIALGWLFLCLAGVGEKPALAAASTFFHDGWQRRWGDSPRSADGHWQWIQETEAGVGRGEWLDVRTPQTISSAKQNDFLWLRVRLPAELPADSIFLVRLIWQAMEVYVGDELLYSYGTLGPSPDYTYRGNYSHFVKLQPRHAGQWLYLRFYSQGPFIGSLAGVHLSTASALWEHLIRNEMPRIVVAVLAMFLSIIALLMYRQGVRLRIMLAFACFSLVVGVHSLAFTTMKQFIYNDPEFWSWVEFGALYLMPLAIVWFNAELLGGKLQQYFGRGARVYMTVYALIMLGAALGIMPLWRYIMGIYAIFCLGSPILIAHVVRHALRKDADARIYIVGLILGFAGGLHDVLLAFDVVHTLTFVYPFGVLAFILSFTFIIARKVMMSLEARKNLELTGSVQQLLLPSIWEGATYGQNYVIDYKPYDKVSGDWVVTWDVPGKEQRIIFGDVVGKGPQAALAVAAIIALLKSLQHSDPPPAIQDAATWINSALFDLFQGRVTSTFSAISWGMDGSYGIYNAGGVGWFLFYKRKLKHYPLPANMLGIGPTASVAMQRVMVAPGTAMFAFSDGVLEGARPIRMLKNTFESFPSDELHVSHFWRCLTQVQQRHRREDDQLVILVRSMGREDDAGSEGNADHAKAPRKRAASG